MACACASLLCQTLVTGTLPVELRGTVFGVFNLITGLALLLVVAGALWDAAGPQVTFLVGAGFAATIVAGLLSIRDRLKEAEHACHDGSFANAASMIARGYTLKPGCG
ncbi:hypothetical protein MPLB_1720002 [Mesorhizobium sp. ORS 3324]|nr:hypothetical protein MPLB_1720002 [Mesorhizobium sp. ORS 3324]